mgnify:CR=1 FL=1
MVPEHNMRVSTAPEYCPITYLLAMPSLLSEVMYNAEAAFDNYLITPQ